MLRIPLTLAWIEFKVYLRNRTAIFWTFVNPVVTLVVLMIVFGGQSEAMRLTVDLQVAPAARAAAPEAVGAIVKRLSDSGFIELREVAGPPERKGALGASLAVEGSAEGRRTIRLQQLYGQTSHFRLLETAIAAAIADINLKAAGASPSLTVDARTRPGREGAGSYGEYLAVGILALTIVSVCLFGFSVPLVELRSRGAGRMYQIFPMTTVQFMAGYILSRLAVIVALGIVIILFADLVYGLAFQVSSPGFLLSLFALCLGGAVAFIAIGLMVAGLSGSVAAANAFVNLLYLPLMMFSDIFLPLSLFPEGLERALRLNPVAQYVNGARAILIDGASLSSQWLAMASLMALALVALLIARSTFHWRET